MTILQSLALGLVQGVTEFFPISSSGHLVILENFFGLAPEEHIFFNIMVHGGTLLAILLYFRKDLIKLLQGLIKKDKSQVQLFLNLIISTIPIVIVGLTLEDQITAFFNSSKSVAIAMLSTALFFLIGEYFYKSKLKSISFPKIKALIIGLVQCVAIIPGVSRSGSTLTAALLTGIDREKAAEYSFLIAIPAISGAVILSSLKVISDPSTVTTEITPLLFGFITSFISGYFSIKFLMHLYKKHTLIGFSIYLSLISVFLLAFS